jgi:peptidyl-prolyl cis-trans isomerase SurA
MTWCGRLARAWVVVALAACGCMSGPSAVSALPADATPFRPDNTPSAGTSARDEASGVTRSQNPETTVTRTSAAVDLLDLPVDRPAEASRASPAAIIRAVVNGEPIFDEEVKVACYQQLFAARSPSEQQEIIKRALDQIIDREIVLQDALAHLERGGKQGEEFIKRLKEVADKEFEKRWLKPIMKQNNMSDKEEFASFMRSHHISLEAMRRVWQHNFMVQEYLKSRIEPHVNRIGHNDIADYYAGHSEEFTQPDSVHWQDIFIDATRHASPPAARKFAESLVRRAREGENFAELSAEFDNGTSGSFRKGDGEGRKRGEIFPREAEPILFRMHDNDIEIVERPRGFHIVRLVKREYAGPIPFNEKVQKEIRDKLRYIVFERETKRIVTDLKRKAVIQIATKPAN